MITFVIGLSGDEEDLISFHHLLVCMALLTDLGMKLLPKFHHLRLIPFNMGILWRPWQSVHVGESGFPARTDLPWMLSE